MVSSVFIWVFVGDGIRKAGTSAHTGAKIESWRAIFRPWENPIGSKTQSKKTAAAAYLLYYMRMRG